MFVLDVSIYTAFGVGIVSAFLPCNYPLIIGFLSLLFGTEQPSFRKILIPFLFFSIGFTAIYVLLGIIVGFLGALTAKLIIFNYIKLFITYLLGVLLIIFGFAFLRIIPIFSFINKFFSIRFFDLNKIIKLKYKSFLLGVVFALTFSPCISPVLGSILILASSKASVLSGAILLAAFSIGLIIPIFFMSIFYAAISKYILKFKYMSNILQFLAGVLFILIGVGILVGGGSDFYLNEFILELFD